MNNCERSALLRRISGRGLMLATGLSWEAAVAATEPFGEALTVAARMAQLIDPLFDLHRRSRLIENQKVGTRFLIFRSVPMSCCVLFN